ncbi:MAG: methyl-accepting chemotaxis protein [Actinomycetota bacterium]
MFENLKLRQRILAACLIPMFVLLGSMLVLYLNVRDANRAARQLDESRVQEDAAYQVHLGVFGLQRAIRGYLLLKDPASRRSFEESEALLRRNEEQLRQIHDPQQAEVLRRLQEVANDISVQNRAIMDLMETGKETEALTRFRQDDILRRSREQAAQLANRFLQGAKDVRQAHQEKFRKAMDRVSRALLLGTVLSIAVAFGVIWWMVTDVSRKISGYATHLASAATQIAATVAEHERTASQQAAAANETSVTIEELSASSRQSAEQAASVATMAGEATRNTEQGSATTRDTLMAMAELKDKIGRMSDHIVRLSDQVGQIGIIAILVRDLAGEINMLALNAAVEASRAGEYGKGFAVVASEVRKLADQSKKSAEQATGIVTDIQKATSASIMMTEDSSRMVVETTRRAEQVGSLFNLLADMISNVSISAQQVMLNAQQQAAAFNQVVEATGSISAGTRETAAGISQTKNAVEQLNQAAQNLKAMA